jgi:hypothetical protein
VPSLDEPAPMPQDDWAFRNLASNVDAQGRQIDDLVRLLSGYIPQQFSAFDQSGQPFNWETLARLSGAWPGIVATSILHNYTVYDASLGATPKIRVTPGNHVDGTGGGSYIPTINGTAINVQTGSPPAYPALTVGGSDTLVWFKIATNAQDGTGTLPAGAITSIEIHSGTTLPANDNVTVYQIVAMIVVTISGSVASVKSLEGGVAGSQAYQYCQGALFGIQ